MDARTRPDRFRHSTFFRWPLLLVAIAMVAAPAGYAVAQATQSTEPSGSPADWSQADWIAHDPALDPAAWENARWVPMECPAESAIGDPGDCYAAQGLPKTNHDAPPPWPGRKLWCEETLSPALSAKDPTCDAQVIPGGYSPELKAELEAYGVDRAFGGGTE
jgi:hypothetical protein